MNDEIISRILNQYGMSDFKLLQVEKGYRNESHSFSAADGRLLNLIVYKREPDILKIIRNANKCGNYLAEQGFPARRTYDNRIIELKSDNLVKYACLYDYLEGHTIPWEAYTMNHLKLLGKTLGAIHLSLKNLDISSFDNVATYYLNKLSIVSDYLSRSGVKKAMLSKLGIRINTQIIERTINVLSLCEQLDEHQVLHMDFVRSNILFNTDKVIDPDTESVAAILDFEKTAAGHPLFDIARTLSFLLVDCKYKTERQVRKYFLQSGYIKRGNNQFEDLVVNLDGMDFSLLEQLINMFLIYDFYKFLLHNPYEYLNENEHFIRTKELLLDRQLILRSDVTISHTI